MGGAREQHLAVMPLPLAHFFQYFFYFLFIFFQVFTRHPLHRFFFKWEWCHLPLLQRLQLMLPHLVLIKKAVSRLFSICKHSGKGNCEKATVGSRGDRRQQGGTRYGGHIWSRGTDYSALDSPGGPLSRGDCPRRDSSSAALQVLYVPC